jgi:PEGA domain
MSAAAHDPGSSESSSGYEDGLGRRVLAIDRETGDMRERLRLRPELRIFGRALQDRLPLVAGLEDERFARPRAIEPEADGCLSVVSEFVAGRRLSDILEAAAEQGIVAGLDAGLGLLLELLPALSRLHDAGISHGALGPGRIMITAAGQIVLLDSVYGEALERLQLTRKRLWAELRLAFPSTAGAPRFDQGADLTQAALTAASLIVGRPLGEDEYPDGLAALRQEVLEIASIRASKAFADGVDKFFAATLPLATRKTALTSADEAAIDLRKLLRKEIGITTCRNAMADFFEQVDTAEKDRVNAAAVDYAREEAGRADRADAERRERERAAEERAERERVDAEIREQARLEAEREAREEAERYAREEAEWKAREEAARKERERLEAERKAREEADRKAREDAARRERERAEQEARERIERARAEAERLERERIEAERKAREEAERKARAEADRKAREEAERKARAEAERKAREEAERKAREEAERKARAEAERKARDEAERKAREEAERKAREEKARKERERLEAERKAREDAERKAREEADRRERERVEQETRERIERARIEAERIERQRIEAERLERERAEQETRERIERARVEGERAERERIERERADRERLERERAERERLEAERREREREEAERRERERAERAAREREEQERAAAAASAGGGWLVPPDRAAAFEPVVDDTPPPPPPKRAYPIYAPSAETESWTPELEPPPAIEIAPVAASAPPPAPAIRLQSSAPASIRLKDEPKPYTPGPARADSRNEPEQISAVGAYEPFSSYGQDDRPMPWKLIAAGVVLIAAVFGIAKGLLPSEIPSPALKQTEAKKAVPPPVDPTAPGSVSITTDPAGIRVLVDGKVMGTSPLTLDKLAPGKHVLTLQGAGGSIKRTIRVEPGTPLAIDIPVFSGFVEIAAPFVVEVAEGGKVIGTSDTQIILGPGRHTLHLQNKDLAYSATQAVDIEPGETARIPIDPRGNANINAVPWAEVFIDGQKAGDTPLANVAIRLGLREIVFKNPNFPERKIATTIKAGEPATITVDFTKDK